MNELSTALRSVLDDVEAKSAIAEGDASPARSSPGLIASADIALRSALLSRRGSFDRWARRRARGLGDAELASAIGRELENRSFGGSPETPAYETRGGNDPALYLGSYSPDRRPDLKGDALIAAARRVMAVRHPD